MWCVEWPSHRQGRQRTWSCSVASAALAIALTISVSVVRGRCAPCCSKEPSGASTISLSIGSALTSGEVRASSRISKSSCPGIAAGAKPSGDLQDFSSVRGACHLAGHLYVVPQGSELVAQGRIEVRRDLERLAGKHVDARCGGGAVYRRVIVH